MKKLYPVLFSAAAALFVILMAAFSGDEYKSSGGAPAGYTNSPADGKNCSHCMGGTAVPVTGWITSNIPPSGYVPGNTYTVTVTATGTGNKGFQVSPQDPAGNLMGSIAPGAGNKIVDTKYLTHTAAQSSNPAIWSFTWTAPSSGAGAITFYGSIAVGKLNTKTTTLTVNQSTVGVNERGTLAWKAFPNPARETVNVSFTMETRGKLFIELLDLAGRVTGILLEEEMEPGSHTRSLALSQPAGTYLLRLRTGQSASTGKLVITD